MVFGSSQCGGGVRQAAQAQLTTSHAPASATRLLGYVFLAGHNGTREAVKILNVDSLILLPVSVDESGRSEHGDPR